MDCKFTIKINKMVKNIKLSNRGQLIFIRKNIIN